MPHAMKTRPVQFHRPSRCIRASALVMAVLLSVIITAMVMMIAWTAGTQAQSVSALRNLDQAFFAAEAGAQQLAWYCKNNKMASCPSPLTGSINGYAYAVTWTTVSGSTIRATSKASLGSVSYTLYQTIAPPITAQPAFASAGDFDNKNIVITGDLATGGNYTNGGSGSLTGNLTYTGTASNTGSVSGTKTHGSFKSIDMTALGNSLIAAAGANNYNGNQTNPIFNFTTIPGPNKVIYVNGNVSNPTFIGSGTLYVNGTLSVSAFGSAANPVNLVATSDITTSNNITMYGTLYSKGNWNRGKMDLTGVVYLGGISASNNGQSHLQMTPAPWFDPRASGGSGTASTAFTNFAGPQP
jgi:hypothetical protein